MATLSNGWGAPASMPISPAWRMKPSIRGCSGHERRYLSIARWHWRPGRIGKDGVDGRDLQIFSRRLRHRGYHQRYLLARECRIPDPGGIAAARDRKRRVEGQGEAGLVGRGWYRTLKIKKNK